MYRELFLLPTENLAVLPGDRNRFSVSKGLQQKNRKQKGQTQVSETALRCGGVEQGCLISKTQNKIKQKLPVVSAFDCSSRESPRQKGCGFYTEFSTPLDRNLCQRLWKRSPEVPKAAEFCSAPGAGPGRDIEHRGRKHNTCNEGELPISLLQRAHSTWKNQ